MLFFPFKLGRYQDIRQILLNQTYCEPCKILDISNYAVMNKMAIWCNLGWLQLDGHWVGNFVAQLDGGTSFDSDILFLTPWLRDTGWDIIQKWSHDSYRRMTV